MAFVTRPDTCGRIAQLTAKVDALRVGGNLSPQRPHQNGQNLAVANYFSKSDLDIRDLRPACRPDAADGDQPKEGGRRLDNLVALPPSTKRGWRHLILWSSQFTRRAVKGIFGSEIYSSKKLAVHAGLLRDFYESCWGAATETVALGYCGSAIARLFKKRRAAESYSDRLFA